MKKKQLELEYVSWVLEFQPRMNEGRAAAFNKTLFDPNMGQESQLILEHNTFAPNRVWSLVEVFGSVMIVNGNVPQNRIGTFLTEGSYNPSLNYVVKL